MTVKASEQRSPLIIAIGGGKGGVGKSMISSNLAVQYAQAGLRTVIIDLDFGAANIHTIFGIRQPKTGLGHYFTTSRGQLSDFILPTSIKGLSLIPASGFVPELANLKHHLKTKLIQHIRQLQVDLVLLDLGAGSAINVVDFFTMTDASIVVTTPEPTAIINAYEFLKNVMYRILFRMARNHPEITQLIKESITPNGSQEGITISALLQEIRQIDSWMAENMEEVCQDLNIYLILNQARKSSQVNLGSKLRSISEKYLNLKLNFAGMVFHNEEVLASVAQMRPISVTEPQSVTTDILRRIAGDIFREVAAKITLGQPLRSFEGQLAAIMRQAQDDYKSNYLTQKRIQRQLDKEQEHIMLTEGNSASASD